MHLQCDGLRIMRVGTKDCNSIQMIGYWWPMRRICVSYRRATWERDEWRVNEERRVISKLVVG